jgi:helicase
LLGRACGASSLSFESGLRLVELMRGVNVSAVSVTSILAIVQVLPEMDSIYTPIMKKGQAEAVRVSQVNQRYGFSVSQGLQRYCADQFEFLCRCKRAAIIWDWLEGTPIDEIEKRFTTNPFQGVIGYGDVMRVVEGTRFHLRSAHQILAALFPDNASFLGELDELLFRLEFGLPSCARALTELSISLTRGQYLAFIERGCKAAADVDLLSDSELIRCVGSVEALRLRPSVEKPLVQV